MLRLVQEALNLAKTYRYDHLPVDFGSEIYFQTFEVQITHRFRNEFDKCYAHLRSLQANPAVGNGGILSEQAGKQKINAYKRINLFLQKFLLHGNADIKYQIASKGFLEQTLDMEFRQVIQDTDPCVLYRGKPDPIFNMTQLYQSHEKQNQISFLIRLISLFQTNLVNRQRQSCSMGTNSHWLFLKSYVF